MLGQTAPRKHPAIQNRKRCAEVLKKSPKKIISPGDSDDPQTIGHQHFISELERIMQDHDTEKASDHTSQTSMLLQTDDHDDSDDDPLTSALSIDDPTTQFQSTPELGLSYQGKTQSRAEIETVSLNSIDLDVFNQLMDSWLNCIAGLWKDAVENDIKLSTASIGRVYY
ncbi:uncharacterized protein N7483_013162 [Penicillium malachiteum]|uniref:uncharacterized protein n=1 Tax=Penicillium malachiteum TaxID=1324776 RepID=UPI002546CBDE|nr:uncharacterized protein N7483_013162 [Penicillium malachiteum]KAJ5715981.1 hypothetical protein N7483_013162 [Penicillium malachiteum]